MIEFKNKKVFFSGCGEKIDKEELIKYFIQNEALEVESFDQADMIIQGYKTPVYLEDKFYLLSKEGIEVIPIEVLEKQFSSHIDIDSILMALKISKEKQRVIKLLNNRYFSDEIFLKLLKFYDWGGEGLFDTDENRDVSTAVVERFSSLQETNHNIKHSPIGIYYTALESDVPKLLEAVYNMPDFSISDKNAVDNQPLNLKEVVALNPNTPKPVLMQILKENNEDELKFLALNQSINRMISNRLYDTHNEQIIKNLIVSGNLEPDNLKDILNDPDLKTEVLKSIPLDEKVFDLLINNELSDTQLVYLSSNGTLNKEQIGNLFEYKIDNVNINLLKNSLCPLKKAEEYFAKNDLAYNIAIAHNHNLSKEMFEKLYNLDDINIDVTLASNKNTPAEIIKGLHEKNIHEINFELSNNENTPINILMQLQVDHRYNTNVSNNETYKEFSRNNLGIIQEENNRFKRDTYGEFWE